MPERNNASLIQSASRGDIEARNDLFARYLPELRAFVQLQLGDKLAAREMASDVVQSACREVLMDLDQLEDLGELAFKRFLFLQAKRKVVSRARYHGAMRRDVRREQALGADVYETAVMTLVTPSRVAAGKDEVERLGRCLASLPDDQRRALLLCRGLGLSADEAGRELELDPGHVRVLLHRALAKFVVIQERLDRDGH
ncbi:MAG: sigma-70 family RNA polymerase sigma factor [Planctomycetes bacterium]|nr:sigma-70 family RNA polymerase sigma factor [Planctomycetota bacterium]MCB9918331.1 sigma-70 family RNA polymerase sigma factor [Planctomycetota bacterium]